jgi:hypothetical protein
MHDIHQIFIPAQNLEKKSPSLPASQRSGGASSGAFDVRSERSATSVLAHELRGIKDGILGVEERLAARRKKTPRK